MSPRRVVVGISSAASGERIGAILVSLGYEVTLAESSNEVLEQSLARLPQVVITDAEFLVEQAKGLLQGLRERLPGTPLIVLPPEVVSLAHGRPEGAVGSMPASELLVAVERVLGTMRGAPPSAQRQQPALDPFVGASPAIRRLAEEALKALASESPILIEGETGTGKNVLAKWLHRHGPRAHEAFVDLNCAGISRELMDSELFGHEKGSFTGAVNSKAGLFEVADKGTLFLDEIGDMERPIQAKLLKVIEEKRFRRVGETRERYTDVRIIAATHHNLLQRVREDLFRADLYYRIGVLPMRMPALRFRSHDIPTLARRVITELATDLGRPAPELSPDAEQALMGHAWPGNVRELRNELEVAILDCGEGPIERKHLYRHSALPAPLPADVAQPGFAMAEHGTLEDMERAYIQHVLDEEQHVERAAQRLGIARSTFYQKLRALGISSRR